MFPNGYKRRRKVIFPLQGNGVSATTWPHTADISNMLIRIDSVNTTFKSVANGGVLDSNGYGFKLETEDGTNIPYQRLSYNATTGQIILKAALPTYKYNNQTEIWLYYEIDTPVDLSVRAGAWSPAGVSLAWSLDETTGVGTNEFKNGAQAGDTNALSNNGTTTVAGQYTGSSGRTIVPNNYLSAPDSTELQLSNNFTISFWVYPVANTGGAYERQMAKTGTANNSFDWYVQRLNLKMMFGIINSAGNYLEAISNTDLGTGFWQYVTLIKSGDTFKIVQNGADVTGATSGPAAGSGNYAPRISANDFNIGRLRSGGSYLYDTNFRIDDVVIRPTTAISVEQAIGEYRAQYLPSSVWYVTGDEELATPALGGWKYRKVITVDKTKHYPSFATSPVIRNYAFLVKETSNDFKSMANGGKIAYVGNNPEIRFTTAGGGKLMHELEFYDPVAGTVVAWVVIPAYVNIHDTIVHMLYGNPTTLSQETTPLTNVWAGSGAQAIFHMNQDPSGTNPVLYDSKRGVFAMNSQGAPTSARRVASYAGQGFKGDGLNDGFIGVDNLGISSNQLQASFWINVTSTSMQGTFLGNSYQMYVGIGNTTFDAPGNNLVILVENIRWGVAVSNIGTGWKHIYVEGGSGGNTFTVWINGVLAGSSSGSNGFSNSLINSVIAANTGASRAFGGDIDEVRFYTASSGISRAQQDYYSQLASGGFYTIAAEENIPYKQGNFFPSF